jgi:hypothetical protein
MEWWVLNSVDFGWQYITGGYRSDLRHVSSMTTGNTVYKKSFLCCLLLSVHIVDLIVFAEMERNLLDGVVDCDITVL